MEVRLTEQDAVCRMDRGADDGKVGKPDIRQARCGCVGVQDAGGARSAYRDRAVCFG